MLDFGCGAGRTLRQFLDEARSCEMWGCDIDEASIAWLKDHLCPPLHVFVNGSEPPLPHPDGAFDLIWAVSVFTHLTDTWSRWLLELRRVLADDGLLYVTFMGSGMCESIVHEPWDESRYGMNVLKAGQSWDIGGPMVLHSPWWIRSRWGRAFEILSLRPDGFACEPGAGHGVVVMRKRAGEIEAADLEAIDPAEPREATALAHNVRQLLAEVEHLRPAYDAHQRQLEASRTGQEEQETVARELQRDLASSNARRAELEAVRADLERRLDIVVRSKSWTMTAPLRRLAAAVRSPRP